MPDSAARMEDDRITPFSETFFFSLVALFWVLGTLKILHGVRALRFLPPRTQVSMNPAPLVSVVIAARNEEERIEATVRRLLAQVDVALEIIVVDDRSTDRTGEILNQLAGVDSRVQVIRVEMLPDGWLGKCHACHQGAQQATGEWILFTDADTWIEPDVVARAVSAATAAGADHHCLLFGLSHGSLLAKACHLLATMSLAKNIPRIHSGEPGSYMGIGAFNLLRTAVYRAAGGHEPLRLTICDDWKLGLLVRRAGGKTQVFLGGPEVQADWFTSPWGFVKALEKNSFAAHGFRPGVVVASLLLLLLCWTGSLLGPWTATPAGILAGLALLLLIVPATLLVAPLRAPPLAALLVPFVFPVLLAVMVNSAVRTLWQGGIRWRETFYPLALLRAGNYR